MSGKTCEECRGLFLPTRASQRFCCTRCANRQRDRRRRRHSSPGRPTLHCQVPRQDAAPDASNATLALAPPSNQALDSVRSQLRTQATDIDRLEAQNSEQRAIVWNLRIDLDRLQTIQRTDTHDLIHLAGKLLALTQDVGVELDNSTKQLFRRRGWTATTQAAQKP